MNVGGHTITSPATVSRVFNNPNYKCSVEGLREKIWIRSRTGSKRTSMIS